MTKYLFPFLTAVGTRVLAGVDACWAALAALGPSRRQPEPGQVLDGPIDQPQSNNPNLAASALLPEMTLRAGGSMSEKNA